MPTSATENDTLRILKENQAFQTVLQLKSDELDESLGEAVISESENEIRLHGIFVKPEHRGRGYARTLMEAVLSIGEAKLITLCTGLGNIAFFKRFGFEVTEVGEGLVSMQKRL